MLLRFLRHDVRSPLTILLGHSEMLVEGLIPQARWPHAFAAMQRQADLLGARLDQLGAGAIPDGQRLLWVGCDPEDVPTAREALGDLLVYIGDPEECAHLRDPGEPMIRVERGATHAAIRREAEHQLAAGNA